MHKINIFSALLQSREGMREEEAARELELTTARARGGHARINLIIWVANRRSRGRRNKKDYSGGEAEPISSCWHFQCHGKSVPPARAECERAERVDKATSEASVRATTSVPSSTHTRSALARPFYYSCSATRSRRPAFSLSRRLALVPPRSLSPSIARSLYRHARLE